MFHSGVDGLLGVLDLRTLGLAIEPTLEEPVRKSMERFDREAVEGRLTQQQVNAALQQEHDLYYRVRAHERHHWFQTLSCSSLLARLFAIGDEAQHAFDVLKAAGPASEIELPLIEWAKDPGCPQAVAAYVGRYVEWWLFGHVWYGRRPPYLAEAIDARFATLFPGGDRWWTSPEFQLGCGTLVEGSATAAELLYQLRTGRYDGDWVEQEIRSRPPDYRLAYEEISRRLAQTPVVTRLQVLAVCADWALHPLLGARGWPWMDRMLNERPVQELLPGFRFMRALRHVERELGSVNADKDAIVALFSSADWQMDEATRLVSELVAEARAQSTVMELHPMVSTIDDALQVRLQKPWALVPPVDAIAINQARISTKGFIGSALDPVNDNFRWLYWQEWLSHYVAEQVTRFRDPNCVLFGGSPFTQEIENECPFARDRSCHDARLRDFRIRNFLQCPLVDAELRPSLGEDWSDRVSFADWAPR